MMVSLRAFRVMAASLTLVAAVLVTTGRDARASAQEQVTAPAYTAWFKYEPEAELSWQFSAVANDPDRVIVRRRGPQSGTPKKVYVLYPRPSTAYDTAITKIFEVFAAKNLAVEFTVVNFRNEHDRGRSAMREISEKRFDLVFTMGSEATAWLHENFRGDIPVVSVCSKDPVELGQIKDYVSGSGTNFAFTSLNMPIDAQMAYLLELKPDLRNIGVLVDLKNVSAVQTQAEPLAKAARQRGIQVHIVGVRDPAQAKDELAQLVPQTVAVMRKSDPTLSNSVFWITGSTAVFREIATINRFADRVPVLSVVPEVVRPGDDSAVLSVGVSFESNAHLAAVYGADILNRRAEAGKLRVGIVTPPDIAINFRKAREIGLKIPFGFFESAGYIYDYDGRIARANGRFVSEGR